MRRESKTLDLDAKKTMDLDAKTTNVDAAFIYMIYLMYWIWLMNFTPCHPPVVLELLGRPDRTAETEAGPVLAMAMDMIMTTFRLSIWCIASRLVVNLRRHPPTSSSWLVGPDPKKLKRSKTLDLDAKTTMSTQIRPVSWQPSYIWSIWWTGSSWWTSPYVIQLIRFVYHWLRLVYDSFTIRLRFVYDSHTIRLRLDMIRIRLDTIRIRLDTVRTRLDTVRIRLDTIRIRFIYDWIWLVYDSYTIGYESYTIRIRLVYDSYTIGYEDRKSVV